MFTDAEKLALALQLPEPNVVGPEMHVVRLLAEEVRRLQEVIRTHRDQRGDDRCAADDHELYSVLPEGDTRPERETLVTIENCERYIECRQTGREYVSPQRRIEELEALLAWQYGSLSEEQADRLLGMECVDAREAMLASVAAALTRWANLRSSAPPSPNSGGSRPNA